MASVSGVVSYSYNYDGLGNRIRQTFAGTPTDYLLDLQPGLAVVLRDNYNDAFGTMRYYTHAPHGLLAKKYVIPSSPNSSWEWAIQDGLGSIRTFADFLSNDAVLASQSYAPYGEPFDGVGGYFPSWYGFTGEWQENNVHLLYLRARYYNAAIGTIASLDPLETPNRYAYVGGNPINYGDPLGLCPGNVTDILKTGTSVEDKQCWTSAFQVFRDYGVLTVGVWNTQEVAFLNKAMSLIALKFHGSGRQELKDLTTTDKGKFRHWFTSSKYIRYLNLREEEEKNGHCTEAYGCVPRQSESINHVELYPPWSTRAGNLPVQTLIHEFGHVLDTRNNVNLSLQDFVKTVGATFAGRSDCSALYEGLSEFQISQMLKLFGVSDKNELCFMLRDVAYNAGEEFTTVPPAGPININTGEHAISGSEDLAESFAEYIMWDANLDNYSSEILANLPTLSQVRPKRFSYFESYFDTWRNDQTVQGAFRCEDWLNAYGLPVDSALCDYLNNGRIDPIAIVNAFSCQV